MAASISISLVVFCSDAALLERTLRSLAVATTFAKSMGSLSEAHLMLVDNDAGRTGERSARRFLLGGPDAAPSLNVDYVVATRNDGYGAGNNLALQRATGEIHLVLNPDVELAVDALHEGLLHLNRHADVVLVSPAATTSSGEPLFLCKRQPTPWLLLLRGFAPQWLRARYAAQLARYEMHDLMTSEYAGSFLASGCFMLMRAAALKQCGGFDNRYFMYFEDFDLSRRLANLGKLAYVPSVRIVHHGGGAAAKGWRHRWWFLRSALRFLLAPRSRVPE